MNRECDKCVYHTSGSCSQWECKGTTTINDVRADERRKFVEWIWSKYDIYRTYNSERPAFDELLKKYEQMKSGNVRLPTALHAIIYQVIMCLLMQARKRGMYANRLC